MQAENTSSLPKSQLWPRSVRDLPHRVHHWLMILVLCLIGFANIRWGERIPVNDGLGWDGMRYGIVTAHLEELVRTGQLNVWLTGRIFPCVVVHYGLCSLGLPLTTRNIIMGFEVLNLAQLLLSCVVWILIANERHVTIRGRWLGFMALFVNFAILKQAFYYPVLTDTTAFTLGILFLYFYMKDAVVGMLLTLFAAAFTWPTFVFPASLLLVIPLRPPSASTATAGAFARVSATAVAGIFAVVLFIVAPREDFLFAAHQQAPILWRAVVVSAFMCILYLFFATRTLLDGLTVRYVVQTLANWREAHFVLALGGVVMSQLAIRALSGTNAPTVESAQSLVHVFALLPISRPLISLVGHVVYFGPAVILMLLFWSGVCEEVRRWGLGMVVFIFLLVLLSLTPESRQMICAWPFFVVFLVQTTEQREWKPWLYIFLAASSLLFSKIWLPINVAPLTGSFLEFPFQRYFMNHGPWMNNVTYSIQGAAAVLLAIVLWRSTRRSSTPTTDRETL